MNVDIEELKRLAEAATPGPWRTEGHVVFGVNHGKKRVASSIWGAPNSDENLSYIAAANPAAILELIAEMERLREDANDLTIELESSEKALKDSRANDCTAMGYLADCRIAVGDNGNRMFPEFVEYLRQLKQQRDELLAALKVLDRGCRDPHCIGVLHGLDLAREAIARAEG